MTDVQENKLSMYLVVKKVCQEYSSAWSTLPAFGAALTSFSNCIADINLAVQTQTKVITGFAKDKLEEKEEMVIKTVQIASSVFAFAKSINDQALADAVDYKPTKLNRLRDTTLRDVCTKISELANENIAALAPFGITPADITTLNNEIADYDKFLSAPRHAIGTRVFSTKELAKLFRDADSLLKNQLDRLMEQYRTSNKRFYTRYKNARQIIDLGSRKQKETLASE
jgi:hypothetical protein